MELLGLTIKQQDASIRTAFPGFVGTRLEPRFGSWTGTVKPREASYRLRIDYRLPEHLALNVSVADYYPRIYLPDSELEEVYERAGKQPPHTWARDNPKRFHLCLFDPRQRQWFWRLPIGDTLLKRACEWLIFYEDWLETGEWFGGGNHPDTEDESAKDAGSDEERRSAAEAFRRKLSYEAGAAALARR